MKRSRFSEEQIIAILREQEADAKTIEVCRKHGISDATFYKWKAKYGGMEVSDARHPRRPAAIAHRSILQGRFDGSLVMISEDEAESTGMRGGWPRLRREAHAGEVVNRVRP